MKHVMFGVTAVILIVMMVLILSSLEGGTTRSSEVNSSLHAVLKDSLADVMERREYSVSEDRELIADLTAQMMRRLNTGDDRLKLTVDIAGVDAKKGLVAVHVREEFSYPNGRHGTAEDQACIVLEREKEREIYEIRYRLAAGDAKALHVEPLCRSYLITEGMPIKAPGKLYGKTVRYWQLMNSDIKITPKDLRKKTVTGSSDYVAVF